MRAPAAPRSQCRYRARHLIWLAAVLGALALPVAAADDAAEYQQKLEQLRENITELKQQLESVKTRKGQLEEKLENSETEISDLKQKIDTITDQLEDGQKELKQLNERQQSLRRERQSQKAKIAAQVRSAYRAGPQSPLKILLDQQSPERLTRLHKYHDYVIRARRDKLTDYLDTLSELEQIQPRISQRQEQLSERKRQLSLRQRQLREQQTQRAKTLEELAGIIANKDAELAAQRQNRQHLQQLLDEMTATVGSSRPTPSGKAFSRLKGQLPWPAKGQLRHRYGSAKMAGQLDWDGMVITAEAGAPVRAIHSGRVIFAEYLRGHGLLLIVDHGEGYMSLYAHNQQLLKRPGDAVAGGEVIARMGRSGGQRYTGLYFEIRHNGRPTDPADWLVNA